MSLDLKRSRTLIDSTLGLSPHPPPPFRPPSPNITHTHTDMTRTFLPFAVAAILASTPQKRQRTCALGTAPDPPSTVACSPRAAAEGSPGAGRGAGMGAMRRGTRHRRTSIESAVFASLFLLNAGLTMVGERCTICNDARNRMRKRNQHSARGYTPKEKPH